MVILPTLRQLQFFAALVKRRSFSKAAEDCLVSQSTLSSGIKELEAILEQQLVDRSSKKFALTPLGEEVARRGADILARTEELASVAQARQPLEGPFSLGVIPTIAPFLLPRATPKLRAAFPKLQLFLREGLSASLAEDLLAGRIDAALLAFPFDMQGVDHVEIGEDPFWFVTAGGAPAPKKPMANEDLDVAHLLLLEEGHCLRDHALEACRLKAAKSGAGFEATSLFTLAQMVAAGLGDTLLPQMAVTSGFADAAGLKARRLADKNASRRIGVAWRRGCSRADEVRAIADVLAACMHEKPSKRNERASTNRP